jgi:hypothetical protein
MGKTRVLAAVAAGVVDCAARDPPLSRDVTTHARDNAFPPVRLWPDHNAAVLDIDVG